MTITPGPWKYNDGNLPDADHKEYGFFPIYAEVECTCIPKHRRPRRYIPFSDEDVRLIAAAPQLLEACKLALEKCNFPVGTMKVKDALATAIAAAGQEE